MTAALLAWLVLGLSEGATVALCTVIVSAVVGPVAVIAAGARARRIEAAVGTPNGHGDVATMLATILHQQAQLLDGQTSQDMRLASIDGRLSRGDVRMADHGARISTLADQVGTLTTRVERTEASCSALPGIEAATEAIAAHTDTDRRHTDTQT